MRTIPKKLSAILCLILALIFACIVVGCSSKDMYGDAPMGALSEAGDSLKDADDASAVEPEMPIRKQLTGAEWRDALNYEFWLNLFEENIVSNEENETQFTRRGTFYDFKQATRGLDTFNMHEVSVTCNENPVVGATVKLYDENNAVFSAVTDSEGKAYVFGNGTRVEAKSGDFTASSNLSDGVTNIELADFSEYENELEIMLVVDTTGSMGDELSFLCEELAGVVTRIASALQCKIRLGLLFYRDIGDEYVTRKFDFVDVSSSDGLATVVNNIKNQQSAGGGDYPEAVDTALTEAIEANWHSYSKTRLIFHVLDAPYHDEQENQTAFSNAVKSAAEKGIRIIPVVASGLNTLGQYIMRSAALLTGGTYVFLTDDSGIGDSHELPVVGEFTVEYLSDLMVRLIKGYYTGTFEKPVPWTQSENVA